MKSAGSLFSHVGNINDANDIDISGIYRGSSNNVNTPANYGLLVSFIARDYRLQLFSQLGDSAKVYTRTYLDGSWSAWIILN